MSYINILVFGISDDEKTLLHFKLRVLDLVEMLVQREQTNPLVLVSFLSLGMFHRMFYRMFHALPCYTRRT